jgi:catechol 2,3-dioxygenase-like lactoylglutathione lyase family enzyme
MTPSPRALVPMAFVADVRRSIAFYTALGFALRDTVAAEGDALRWAYLEHDNAHLMLARATDPVIPSQQAVLFYLYFDDIAATHAQVQALGFDPGPMTYPFYCPKGEFRVADPDGYCLMFAHT